jgi:hypothetical protein
VLYVRLLTRLRKKDIHPQNRESGREFKPDRKRTYILEGISDEIKLEYGH